MSQTIKLKRSSVTGKAPTATDLELGELAINTFDGKLFIKKDDGTTSEIIEVGSAPVGYNNTNWDTAYGWGNHGSAGYLTSIPTPSSSNWWNGYVGIGGDGVMEMGKYMDFHTTSSGGNNDYDLRVTVSPGVFAVGGQVNATGGNSSQWNTAYGWGDHALEGYLTSLPSHVHTIANVTGLQSALNGKVDDGQVLTNVPAGAVFTDTVYYLPEATATTRGGIEIFSNTDQTVGANAVSATAGRTYGIQLNSAGQAVVNVPWVDTNTNTWRPIHDTPVDGATTTSISSNWAFDNVKTAVPTGALFTDTVYTHPSHPGDDISIDTGPLSGATVISDLDFNVTTDTLGHVTDANATISTRNLTAADVGAAAASHNHDGRYYTETESDSRYVNVTGDTMTGRLINSTTGRSVTVGGNPPSGPNATVATQTSYLEVAAGSGSSTGSSGLIFHNPGISTSVLEYVNTNSTTGYFNFKSDDTSWEVRSNNNKVWHAGNDGSGSGLDADTVDGLDLHTGRNNQANKVVRTDASGYIQAGWINTTSGVTTGTNRIYASNDGYIRYVTNDTFRNNLGLWWTGNDGSGSGLDADLLDGQHGSYYAPASHSHSLTLSGDVSGSGSVSGTISVTVNNDSHSHSNYMPYGTGGSVNVNSLLGTVLFTGSTGGWSNRGPSGNNAGALLSLNTHPGSYYSQLWFDTAGSSFYHRTANNTTPTASWRKVWDAGNDGSGSGLDADLLDGQHGSYYATANHNHTLTLSGDVSGSGSVSGTISVTVNNDSHSHSNYVDLTSTQSISGAKTFTSGSNHYNGHLYYEAYDANGNHYPHFLDGSGSNGVTVNWRIYNGSSLRLNEWDYTYNRFHTNVQAPIFYDSDNTSYYGNFADSDNSLRVAGNIKSVGNYGRGVVGVYSASRLQHLWSMGEAYLLAANGTTSGNLYGLAWSHPNAGTIGGANQLASHGMLLLENGVFKGAWGGGRLVTPSDIRGTLFYDYNNTAYFVDPTSSSESAVFRGSIRMEQGNTCTKGIELNSVKDSTWPFEFTTNDVGNDNSSGFWVGSNGYPDMRLRRDDGTVRALISSWEESFVSNGFRAEGTSQLNGNLYVGSGTSSNIFMRDSDHGNRRIHCNSNRIGFLNEANSWGSYCGDGGDWYSDQSVRSPIFYDSDNTGYYWNPNTSGAHRLQTPSGYLDIGPMNATYCHFQTDRGEFYFDKTVRFDGAGARAYDAYATASFSAYYDYVDTSYYTDSASESVMAKIKVKENTSNPGYTYMTFKSSADTQYGSIYRSYGTMVYGTSSDYRLKENVVSLSNASDRLNQLQPKRFNFIEYSDVTVDGFIAHEVAEVVPEAVVGEKDAVDHHGKPIHQSVDHSKLVPLLTASLQEALVKIEDLETRLSLLEQ